MSQIASHNDAADWNAASYRPDIAQEIDQIEDSLLDILTQDDDAVEDVVAKIRQLGLSASPGTMRVVVGIAAGLLRKADAEGYIQEMFGSASPVREDVAEFARTMMELIDGDRNPKLQARCVNFVKGMGLDEGKSQTQIAKEEGVTKAAVSKRCINLRNVLGLPPARGMKTDEARENYRQRQRGKRARPPREPWRFEGLFGRALHAAYA